MVEKNSILAFGCSFTWGEGLYYYSDLPNLPLKEYHEYNGDEMTDDMLEFKNTHRYLNLVSTDLGIPYKYPFDKGNGGSTIGSFLSHHYELFKTDYSTVKYIIWQTTAPEREWSAHPVLTGYSEDTYYFMNDSEYDEYHNMEVKRQLVFMHKRIKEFEKMGCEIIIFNWYNEYVKNEYYQKHFKKYHLPLIFDGNSYDAFEDVLCDEPLRNKYTISGDFRHRNLQKNDTHFNLKGQRVIADNIITRINELSTKNII